MNEISQLIEVPEKRNMFPNNKCCTFKQLQLVLKFNVIQFYLK